MSQSEVLNRHAEVQSRLDIARLGPVGLTRLLDDLPSMNHLSDTQRTDFDSYARKRIDRLVEITQQTPESIPNLITKWESKYQEVESDNPIWAQAIRTDIAQLKQRLNRYVELAQLSSEDVEAKARYLGKVINDDKTLNSIQEQAIQSDLRFVQLRQKRYKDLTRLSPADSEAKIIWIETQLLNANLPSVQRVAWVADCTYLKSRLENKKAQKEQNQFFAQSQQFLFTVAVDLDLLSSGEVSKLQDLSPSIYVPRLRAAFQTWRVENSLDVEETNGETFKSNDPNLEAILTVFQEYGVLDRSEIQRLIPLTRDLIINRLQASWERWKHEQLTDEADENEPEEIIPVSEEPHVAIPAMPSKERTGEPQKPSLEDFIETIIPDKSILEQKKKVLTAQTSLRVPITATRSTPILIKDVAPHIAARKAGYAKIAWVYLSKLGFSEEQLNNCFKTDHQDQSYDPNSFRSIWRKLYRKLQRIYHTDIGDNSKYPVCQDISQFLSELNEHIMDENSKTIRDLYKANQSLIQLQAKSKGDLV